MPKNWMRSSSDRAPPIRPVSGRIRSVKKPAIALRPAVLSAGAAASHAVCAFG